MSVTGSMLSRLDENSISANLLLDIEVAVIDIRYDSPLCRVLYLLKNIITFGSSFYRPHSEGRGKVMFSEVSICSQGIPPGHASGPVWGEVPLVLYLVLSWG